MFELPQTKTELAKWLTQLCVGGYTDKALRTTVANHTDLDPNSVPMKAGGFVAGMYVGHKARPYTDNLIDTAISRYQTWQQKKNSKTAK